MATRRRAQSNANRVSVSYMDLGDIQPYENNPRDNEPAIRSVANSIQSFGFLVPIVVDSDHVIVAGHTRYEASKLLGLTEVPVIVADQLTEEQIRQFRLIDNKVSELARWDYDMLSQEITALQESGVDFTDFGWSSEEIDCLTEVVADDCLSAANLSDTPAGPSDAARPRGPATTRFVFGEFVFFVPSEAYRQWANSLRSEFDYREDDILMEIKRRLGLPVGADL